mgnify:CR=1 FL=1
MRKLHALRLAAVYALVAVTWILFSDSMLFRLGVRPDLLSSYSLLKGLGFVAVTSIALYVLVRRFTAEVARRERMYRELFEQNRRRELGMRALAALGHELRGEDVVALPGQHLL